MRWHGCYVGLSNIWWQLKRNSRTFDSSGADPINQQLGPLGWFHVFSCAKKANQHDMFALGCCEAHLNRTILATTLQCLRTELWDSLVRKLGCCCYASQKRFESIWSHFKPESGCFFWSCWFFKAMPSLQSWPMVLWSLGVTDALEVIARGSKNS